jgi:hypothetical protein
MCSLMDPRPPARARPERDVRYLALRTTGVGGGAQHADSYAQHSEGRAAQHVGSACSGCLHCFGRSVEVWTTRPPPLHRRRQNRVET